ncbi:MAG: hypothetical protein IT469_01630 [Pseudomonadales bacterium]|nr:hypothetical protein [Pseudomonadales bacterium]
MRKPLAHNHRSRQAKRRSIAQARRLAAVACRRLGIAVTELAACSENRWLTRGRADGLARKRELVWRSLRARGISLPVIAVATGARCHSTVHRGLARRKGAA